MVDYRKDVYRHLGTHCGGELGKKTQRNGPYWLGLFLTLVSMLVVIRTPVQIIDYSNVAQVYEVDNVPIGLAIPASLTTRVGNALIQSYEMVFALPDSVTYSKTGMLFGSNLVAKSTDFLSQNPQITTLFSDYVQNCVMGDIFLNHKYSFEELLNSPDPYTLIFANPSHCVACLIKTTSSRHARRPHGI
jgi:conjugal transfer mating pair stabilization protein TraG